MNKVNSEDSASYDVDKKLEKSKDDVIKRAIEILDERIKHGDALCSPIETRQYLRLQLAEEVSEVFCVLWLDNKNRVIHFQRMFNGTIDGASVYPREIVRHAIANNAASCILVHNHPSGCTEPSTADKMITHRIVEALNLIDVRTLDHMIVGDEVVSFAERGLI